MFFEANREVSKFIGIPMSVIILVFFGWLVFG